MMSPAALPRLSPMLASPGPLPSGPGWAFEFKWDGVRALVTVEHGHTSVASRSERDVSSGYPELAALGALPAGRRVILDGEIVLDPAGVLSFSLLQQRMHVAAPSAALLARAPARLYVFDLLYLDNELLLQRPYAERRAMLAGLDLGGDIVELPPHWTDIGGEALLGRRPRVRPGGSGGQAAGLAAERREVIEGNRAWDSAQTVRRQWLAGLLGRKTAPAKAAAFIAGSFARRDHAVNHSLMNGIDLARELLGLEPEGHSYGDYEGYKRRRREMVDLIEQGTDGRALLIGLGLILAAYEQCADRNSWRRTSATDTDGSVSATPRYLRYLESCGYELAPIERRACGEPAESVATDQ